MYYSLILAHPDPKSFIHTIAHTVLEQLNDNGHRVVFHDLYAEEFEQILQAGEISKEAPLTPEMVRYRSELAESDGIIIVYPN